MSDSDSDGLSNTVLPFPDHAKQAMDPWTHGAMGPHLNNTNISGLSFRNNNMLTSTMNVPWNCGRSRYEETGYDQRTPYGRAVSPMSVHSASGMPSRSFLHPSSLYHGFGRNGSKSVYNSRGVSPTSSVRSFRTVDSNTSTTAHAIVDALKNTRFNMDESRMLNKAFKAYMKNRTRRRVEKKRSIRKFLKGGRRVSGGESGDMPSDSSDSSDDCRSVRSSRTMRSVRTDYTDIRKLIPEDIYRDCTESFKQNTFRNLCSPRSSMQHRSSNNPALTQQNMYINNSMMTLKSKLSSARSCSSVTQTGGVYGFDERFAEQRDRRNCSSVMSQKERFQTGYQLPSQRFQQSISSHKPQQLQGVYDHSIATATNGNHFSMRPQRRNSLNDSASDCNIFSTGHDKQTTSESQQKRTLDDDVITSSKKRTKVSSPQKVNANPKPKTSQQTKPVAIVERKAIDFVFAKPQLPIRRLAKAKSIGEKTTKQMQPLPPAQEETSKSPEQKSNTLKSPERKSNTTKSPKPNSTQKEHSTAQKLSKNRNVKKPSKQSLNLPETSVTTQLPTEILISKSSQPLDRCPAPEIESVTEKPTECAHSDITQNTTDLSMRPSFIKRKLFTQKVDVSDKNSSSDSVQADSPGSTIYSSMQKEKNKTRKMTSQSYISREIGNESNLMDLIYKIVPQDRMNATLANRSETHASRNNTKVAAVDTAKWDVSSAVTQEAGNESDTFTDEEIFNETVVNGTRRHTLKPHEADVNFVNIDSAKTTKAVTKEPDKEDQLTRQSKKKTEENGKKKSQATPVPKVQKSPSKNMNVLGAKPMTKSVNAVDQVKEVSKTGAGMPSRAQVPDDSTPMSPGETTGFLGFHKEVLERVNRFWDSDFESDFECERMTPQKTFEHNKVNLTMTGNTTQTARKLNEHSNKDMTHKEALDKVRSNTLLKEVQGVQATVSSTISNSNNKVASESESAKSSNIKAYSANRNQIVKKVRRDEISKEVPVTKNPDTKTSNKIMSSDKKKVNNNVDKDYPIKKCVTAEIDNEVPLNNIPDTKTTKKVHSSDKKKVSNKIDKEVSIKKVVRDEIDNEVPLTKIPNTKTSNKVCHSDKHKIVDKEVQSTIRQDTIISNKVKSSDKGKTKIDQVKTRSSEKENTVPNKAATETTQNNVNDLRSQTYKETHNSKRTNKNTTVLKINNNTLRFKPKHKEADQSLNDSSGITRRSLRSRQVDLSGTFNSTTSANSVKRVLPERSATVRVNKNLKKLTSNDNKEHSDSSFTMRSDSTPLRKKPTGLTNTRKSDVDFTLLTDKTPRAAPVAARRNTRSRSNLYSKGVPQLLNMSTRSMTAGKRTLVPPKRYNKF